MTMKRKIRKLAAPKNEIMIKGYRAMEKGDMSKRFFAFMIDTCVMISPIMIWNILILAIFGNIVSVHGLTIITLIIGVLLLCSILFLNSFIYTKTKGFSFGMKTMGLRVIGMSGKVAYKRKLVFRELLGFDIPFLVLMYFTSIFGTMLFWMINGLIVLVDPKHRSWIDFITRTQVVVVDKSVNQMRQPVMQKVVEKPKAKQPLKEVLTTIDLHIHSNFSANGQYNVEEIFQKARDMGLSTISITDLDCAKSIPIAKRMSELYHIQYVPGIEINAELDGKRVRVLGYFIDYPHELYNQIENDSLINEKQASIERVAKFEKIIGMQVPVERLLLNNRFQRIPGEMIAEYVLNRPEFKESPLLQPYLSGSKSIDPYREMAKDFFAYGKLCYVPVKYPNIRDVLDVIHLTNGIAILAHPGKLLANDTLMFKEILTMDIDGIEVFHPSHSKEEVATLLKIAVDKKLFVSAGSGFYDTKKQQRIGNTGCHKDNEKIVKLFVDELS